ncbi:MAG: aspartate kinase, partial [Hymenobacteraceae bacterium]|nr:aspartate kinase [Hymenobacteraceae bacterium]MDX5396549.1 aspartate kinase [Hymenobacteraceae bacterium]MDX5512613.1 aspartate kinase [Hymenobacteraceae bacterium]
MKVFKFGGASVKDAAAFQNLAKIVEAKKEQEPLLVVVSAMGKTTNALEQVFNLAYQQQDFEAELQQSITYHKQVLEQLFEGEKEHPVFQHMEKLFHMLRMAVAAVKPGNYDKQYDQVISFGELLSSVMLHHYLNLQQQQNVWVDCRKYIQTDTTWREGRVNWAWT